MNTKHLNQKSKRDRIMQMQHNVNYQDFVKTCLEHFVANQTDLSFFLLKNFIIKTA